MSNRTPSKETIANRQRRNARLHNWRNMPLEDQNLVVRRLATQRQLRKAKANAAKIAADAAAIVTKEATDAVSD